MITIVNLKTNMTGQVADHIGLDDKLLASQGYARIDLPQMPEFVQTSTLAESAPQEEPKRTRKTKIKNTHGS